ncbi:MAG TPA: hypothetical protein ENN67_01030 [Firmicutes bacterium]|nr:hypothetical protein [Bacillota bacterium]
MKNLPVLLTLIIILSSGCSGKSTPIAPSGDTTPPVWDDKPGLRELEYSEDYATLHWGTATDADSPPVFYLIYKTTDENPWDSTPIERPDNEPYTFTDLTPGVKYRFGVRCRDSADPSNIDTNTVVLTRLTGISNGDDHDNGTPTNSGWVESWGGTGDDSAHGVAVSQSGNVFITGHFEQSVDFNPGDGVNMLDSNGGSDVFILELDASGEFKKAVHWGGSDNDSGTGICLDNSGNVFVSGFFSREVDFNPGAASMPVNIHDSINVFLSRFDSAISFHWTEHWGWKSGLFSKVAVDSDGNCLAGGTLMEDDTIGGFARKILPDSSLSWNFVLGEDGSTLFISDIAVDKSGNLLVTGHFMDSIDFDPGYLPAIHASQGEEDAFLAKFSPGGNLRWVNTWGGDSADKALGIATDHYGNVYVTGQFSGTVYFDTNTGDESRTSEGGTDAFLCRFDMNGNFIWVNTWGGNEIDSGTGVVADSSGNVYVTGIFESDADFNPGFAEEIKSSNGLTDIFVCKYNGTGVYYWTRTFGGSGNDCPHSVAVDKVGNVYVAGEFESSVDFNPLSPDGLAVSNGGSDCFIVKLLPDGSL